MRIAAAIFIMAGAGAWMVWRNAGRPSNGVQVVRNAPIAQTVAPRQQARVDAVGRWSVPIETKRPGMQIVWLYESKELHAAAGDKPAPRDVR